VIDPGRLKTRLLIQAPVETDDGQGGVARTFVTQATVWAAVLPAAAHRDVAADADGADVRLRIIVRARPALTLQHRLLDGGKVYRIVTLRAVDDGRFVEIEAAWRIG
jgi:SPP1 family predicted phage head-tail adaptor